MATDPAPRPFDVATVEHLIGLMAKHDLSEIALQEGAQRIRLKRGGAVVTYAPAPQPAAPSAAPPPAGAAPAAAPAGKKLVDIKSVMVGTVYLKPKPDKDEFVKVGSAVKPDTVVCTIEAMKIYNDIRAEMAGTVAEVCVQSGDVVDFGAVLFRVDPG